jgi:hypothetical protein
LLICSINGRQAGRRAGRQANKQADRQTGKVYCFYTHGSACSSMVVLVASSQLVLTADNSSLLLSWKQTSLSVQLCNICLGSCCAASMMLC